ncbi:hypothetical protein, partial [Sphingorhabdus sp.]|uniref:hypothetical protein n=1 Tax=Sphingorhabdus sp. TaxID=1902408 RepID=UPI0037C59F70
SQHGAAPLACAEYLVLPWSSVPSFCLPIGNMKDVPRVRTVLQTAAVSADDASERFWVCFSAASDRVMIAFAAEVKLSSADSRPFRNSENFASSANASDSFSCAAKTRCSNSTITVI